MAWSYDESLATDTDWVRMRIGDTDATGPLLSDEAIASFLAEQATRTLAAASACDAIAAIFTRKANSFSAGGTSVNWGDRAKAFRDLATQLRTDDAAAEAAAMFDVAEMNFGPFSERELFRNAILRGAV